LRSLVAELSSADGRAQLDLAELRALPPQQLQGHALEACRALASLVDRKASKEEAEGVKRWLVAIAQRTAEAAKEGGFLGIGGTRVSETETVAIRDVARALGVAPPA